MNPDRKFCQESRGIVQKMNFRRTVGRFFQKTAKFWQIWPFFAILRYKTDFYRHICWYKVAWNLILMNLGFSNSKIGQPGAEIQNHHFLNIQPCLWSVCIKREICILTFCWPIFEFQKPKFIKIKLQASLFKQTCL